MSLEDTQTDPASLENTNPTPELSATTSNSIHEASAADSLVVETAKLEGLTIEGNASEQIAEHVKVAQLDTTTDSSKSEPASALQDPAQAEPNKSEPEGAPQEPAPAATPGTVVSGGAGANVEVVAAPEVAEGLPTETVESVAPSMPQEAALAATPETVVSGETQENVEVVAAPEVAEGLPTETVESVAPSMPQEAASAAAPETVVSGEAEASVEVVAAPEVAEGLPTETVESVAPSMLETSPSAQQEIPSGSIAIAENSPVPAPQGLPLLPPSSAESSATTPQANVTAALPAYPPQITPIFYPAEMFCFFWNVAEPEFGSFCQWHQSPMRDGEFEYNCCEQYMMAAKARIFGDSENWLNIMIANDPAQIKKFGRQVANYNEQRWCALRFEVVLRANFLKFTQNEELRDRLLSTRGRMLVEASPYDAIWGIKARASDRVATCPALWQGQNLLGIALMIVREAILHGSLVRHHCLVCRECPAYTTSDQDIYALDPCQYCGDHSASHFLSIAPPPPYQVTPDLMRLCQTVGCFATVPETIAFCQLCYGNLKMGAVYAELASVMQMQLQEAQLREAAAAAAIPVLPVQSVTILICAAYTSSHDGEALHLVGTHNNFSIASLDSSNSLQNSAETPMIWTIGFTMPLYIGQPVDWRFKIVRKLTDGSVVWEMEGAETDRVIHFDGTEVVRPVSINIEVGTPAISVRF